MSDSMRSINSFGVAGLLNRKCDVFYSNDLRVRNIGRVSDLVSAKLRESNIDELRIRAILVHAIFETYALRGLDFHHDEEIPPISVEIGFDPVHVAIAVAFHWEEKQAPNWKGFADRVDASAGESPFEKILESIGRHSTQVIVRYEEKERRIEVVSLINRQKPDLRDPTMVVAIDSNRAPLLEVGNYVELGDLNFAKLLRNPVASDVSTAGDRSPQETLEEVVVKGVDTSPDESVHVVSGGKEIEIPSEVRISGPATANDDEFRELREEYESTVSELKNTVHELRERLESAEVAASERRFPAAGESGAEETPIVVKGREEDAEAKKDDWGLHFLKQVWPFAPREEEAAADTGSETVEPHVQTEAERAAEAALHELQELAKNRKSKKVENTLHEIEEEVDGDKAKRWVESLSSEILHEKAKLNELQKNLAKQMRQRELEFKTAERSLKQELKRKDDLLYQRNAAIENKSDQIAQLNLAVERASASSNDKESLQLKSKLDRAQRLAQMKEEEAKSLVTKVRDLENRLIIAQAKAQKGNDLQIAAKVQTLEKKVEEYRRINQRLMESLNAQKDKSNDKEVGDLRRKIDQLDRLHTESKRNLEKSAFKMRELQESEKKLQGDLARALEENRNLRRSQSRGSGESGGGQAA